MTNIVAGHESS